MQLGWQFDFVQSSLLVSGYTYCCCCCCRCVFGYRADVWFLCSFLMQLGRQFVLCSLFLFVLVVVVVGFLMASLLDFVQLC